MEGVGGGGGGGEGGGGGGICVVSVFDETAALLQSDETEISH